MYFPNHEAPKSGAEETVNEVSDGIPIPQRKFKLSLHVSSTRRGHLRRLYNVPLRTGCLSSTNLEEQQTDLRPYRLADVG